jgi:hypothetical protein
MGMGLSLSLWISISMNSAMKFVPLKSVKRQISRIPRSLRSRHSDHSAEMTCRRRLLKEWKRLQVDDDSSYMVHVNEDNLFEWEAVVFGPKDSIWEDARFRVSLTFSEEYPNQAPVVQFVSRVYHPNV